MRKYGLRHVQELLPRIFDAYYGYLSTDFSSPTEKGAGSRCIPRCWGMMTDDFSGKNPLITQGMNICSRLLPNSLWTKTLVGYCIYRDNILIICEIWKLPCFFILSKLSTGMLLWIWGSRAGPLSHPTKTHVFFCYGKEKRPGKKSLQHLGDLKSVQKYCL